MKWEKSYKEIKTVAELVTKNTGIPENELLDDKKDYRIYGLEKVADKLKEASRKKTFVTVVGDYDCDGITAGAGMDKILTELRIPHRIRLPKRFEEGYGLKETIVDEINEGILFTVDNGIVAFDAIKKARDKGLFTIVTDHHQASPDGRLPEADILIDPSAFPESADFDGYCGAGIVYKLAEILFKESKVLDQICVFAAIGTIADVMKLVKDNRKIVKRGLSLMENGGCTRGLSSLKNVMGLRNKITSTDISFGIGPALNAPGRLEGTAINVTYKNKEGAVENEEEIIADASMSLNILSKKFESWDDSEHLALRIKEINNNRKQIKKLQYELVNDIVKRQYAMDNPIVVYLPKLHLGIIGILAGNLVEDYGVPAIVFTDDPKDPDNLKGSGRSIEEINLKSLLDNCKDDMVQYGGHAGAAGLTVKRNMLDTFRDDLNEALDGYTVSNKSVKYDFEIKEEEVEKWLKEVDKFAPYGEGNPEPRFLIKGYRLFPANGSLFTINGDHVFFQGAKTKANAFFLKDKFETIQNPKYLDIICTLGYSYNRYGKAQPTVFVKELKKADTIPEFKMSEMFRRMAAEVNKQEYITV